MKLSFFLWLIVVSAITAMFFYFMLPLLPEKVQFAGYIYVILFFALATTAFHFGLKKSAGAGSKNFIRFYMMATGLKLMLYIAIIMFFALINKPAVMAFAFTFLITYFVFTTFETIYSYREFSFAPKDDQRNIAKNR